MKLARFFTNSGGFLLLCCAMAFFITNWSSAEISPPRDPLFQVSLRSLFWMLGGLAAMIALICLFGDHAAQQLVWIAWFSTSATMYVLGSHWGSGLDSDVLFGLLPDTFGISIEGARLISWSMLSYLLAGSYGSLLWLYLRRDAHKASDPVENPLKMTCFHCGGHIKFSIRNLGQKIACPHCQTNITLRKPENLKMSCYFCKGHIEFPIHAIGEKTKCPHCRMDITLKEPA